MPRIQIRRSEYFTKILDDFRYDRPKKEGGKFSPFFFVASLNGRSVLVFKLCKSFKNGLISNVLKIFCLFLHRKS